MLYALTTNVHVWAGPSQAKIDACLARHGFELLPLEWRDFELLPDDPDHFTWRGFEAFAEAFAKKVASAGVRRVRVLADSTIDYWNSEDLEADARVERALRAHGVEARVASVCGSGFAARAEERLHFAGIGQRALRSRGDIVVIGGWNDARLNVSGVCAHVRAFSAAYSPRPPSRARGPPPALPLRTR